MVFSREISEVYRMTIDVFISYSSKDKAVADAVVAALEANKVRCWYAPRDIQPGADWGEEIANAVSQSRLFLLIFSHHANSSRRVLDEVNLAINNERIIIPFRIEKLDPSGAMLLHLSSRHWLDAFVPSWEKHIDDLVQIVFSNLGSKSTRKVEHLSLPRKVGWKVITWVLSFLGVILIGALGVSLGFPGILPGNRVDQNIPTSGLTVPDLTQDLVLGNALNPIILMYVPPPEDESSENDFSNISAISSSMADEFSNRNPGFYMTVIPATDRESIVQALCEGQAHIGFLGTFSYLTASERDCADVKMIWNNIGDITNSGMVFVRTDSGFSSLEDLRGKTLCTPHFSHVSGWILPSLEIRANVGDPESFFTQIIPVDGVQAVMDGVYNRECDAGTSYYDSRQISSLPNASDSLTVILQTLPIPKVNISFSNKVDSGLARLLVSFFIEISRESVDFKILNGFATEIANTNLIEINDYFYDDMRDLIQRAGLSPEQFIEY
jgi:ABC-type phosphate/phosphonate transport system substrate-binding protein